MITTVNNDLYYSVRGEVGCGKVVMVASLNLIR
jgi:hypothetical protein